MQIVIDIPDHLYNVIKNKECTMANLLTKAVENGKPLPKGHGRLIDADKLKEEAVDMSHYVSDPCDGVWVEDIDNAPTILDAE